MEGRSLVPKRLLLPRKKKDKKKKEKEQLRRTFSVLLLNHGYMPFVSAVVPSSLLLQGCEPSRSLRQKEKEEKLIAARLDSP
jgi:hypothetical protein